MNINPLHEWDLAPDAAVALQRTLAGRIDVRTPLRKAELIAGADISYDIDSPTFYASVIVMRPDGTLVEAQDATAQAPFPYIPGLLSFREIPALLGAFAKLRTVPDVVMYDGQGIAHPRRLGIASHLGLFLDVPCFGCAKSRLWGRFKEPGEKAGSLAPLMDGDEQIGYVVRTKDRVKPVFVSAGHKIDLAGAVRVTLATSHGYRIPEPTRQAHLRVNRLRRGEPG